MNRTNRDCGLAITEANGFSLLVCDLASPAAYDWRLQGKSRHSQRMPGFDKKLLASSADLEATRRGRTSGTVLLYGSTDDLRKKRLGNEARFGVLSGRRG